MEDNKDFQTPQDGENQDTITTDETTDDNQTGAFADEIAQTQAPNPVEFQQPVETPKNNKKVLQHSIIIAGAIVVALVVALLVWKCFFNFGIQGTWVVDNSASADEVTTSSATGDEAAVAYYTFTDDKDSSGNKIAEISLGTMTMKGTYSTSKSDDGKQTLTVSISYFFTGEYTYEISGNMLTGRKLTLKSSDGQYSYKFNSATVKKPDLKPKSDFKANSKLTGEWNMSDYGITYKFNEDGTVNINESDQLLVDGIYSYNDNKITVTYYASTKTDMDISYALDGKDTLVLNGLGYSRVTQASKDEAKKATTVAAK